MIMNDSPRQTNSGEQRPRGFASGARRAAAMIVLCMVVVLTATGFLAAFQASAEPEPVPVMDEETRIDVPTLETDEFLWEQRAPRFSAPEVTGKTDAETPKSDTPDADKQNSDADIPNSDADIPNSDADTPKTDVNAPKSDAETQKNPPETDAQPNAETADSKPSQPETDSKKSDETPAETKENSAKTSSNNQTPPAKLLADELKLSYTIDKASIQSDITDYELKLAATVIQLEVMGDGSELYAFEDVPEKYTEMLGVAQCIRNRVMSDRFPDTVKEVILQKGQFSPASKLDLYTPTESAMTAAKEVLLHGVTVFDSNYMYFCATAVCATFEKYNAVCLVPNGNTYVKWTGHLTTFYAGN